MTSLDVVIPAYNEEAGIESAVGRLREFLGERMSRYRWRVVVADNGSEDRTPEVAGELARRFPDVSYLRLERKGRGRALKMAWGMGDADVAGYMDADLSTDLSALPPLVEAIAGEDYDVAVGCRLDRASEVERSFKREALSRGYNALIRGMFFTRFRDAQCGFKALGRRAVRELVPLAQDNAWFFDTELLIMAEKRGYRVKEVPVSWREDADTRVRVLPTVMQDLRGLLRMRLEGFPDRGRRGA